MATALPTKSQFTDQSVTQDQFKAALNQLIDYLGEQKSFPSGTRMSFQQSNAPTGWTKDTTATFHDSAIRVVTGAASSGGADAFTTLFGSSRSTAGYALQVADIPSHNHTITDPTHVHGGIPTFNTATAGQGQGFAASTPATNDAAAATGITINNTGGGGAHQHVLSNFNLKFTDFIIASIN